MIFCLITVYEFGDIILNTARQVSLKNQAFTCNIASKDLKHVLVGKQKTVMVYAVIDLELADVLHLQTYIQLGIRVQSVGYF